MKQPMETERRAPLQSSRWHQQTPWESPTSVAAGDGTVSLTALGLQVSSTASVLWVLEVLGQASMVSFPHPTKVGPWREEGMANSGP